MWTHGYIAAFEIAAFVLRTKMQPVPVIFEDSLWRGVVERQKSEALAFQASKEDALREDREWVSRHQQWAAKRVETMREKPAPSDAPLRPDGTSHPNALSAAAAKARGDDAREARALGCAAAAGRNVAPERVERGGGEARWRRCARSPRPRARGRA